MRPAPSTAAESSRVTGDLVVDDRFFDAARFGEGWPGGAQTSESYHAPISALMANYSARREGNEWVAVADPALHFGNRLKELLGLAGVRLEGRVRIPSAAELETFVVPADVDAGNSRIGLPDGLELLYTINSEPLGRLAFDVNKFSNNVMAENILKTLGATEYGHPGTATKGLAVIARFRNEVLGTELTGYVQADGSGLSDLNRVSPRQVAELLYHTYTDFHFGPEFVASLKISGLDGWNPRAFRDPPLIGEMRLKSGHIRGVNTLSGLRTRRIRPRRGVLHDDQRAPISAVGDRPARRGAVADHPVELLRPPGGLGRTSIAVLAASAGVAIATVLSSVPPGLGSAQPGTLISVVLSDPALWRTLIVAAAVISLLLMAATKWQRSSRGIDAAATLHGRRALALGLRAAGVGIAARSVAVSP